MSTWRTISCPGRNAAQAKRSDALQNRDRREAVSRAVPVLRSGMKMPQRARDTML